MANQFMRNLDRLAGVTGGVVFGEQARKQALLEEHLARNQQRSMQERKALDERDTRLKVRKAQDAAATERMEIQQRGQTERAGIQAGLTQERIQEIKNQRLFDQGKLKKEEKYRFVNTQLKSFDSELEDLLAQYKAETSVSYGRDNNAINDLENRMEAIRLLKTEALKKYGTSLGITQPKPEPTVKYTQANYIKAKKLLIDGGYTITNERIKKVIDEGLIK